MGPTGASSSKLPPPQETRGDINTDAGPVLPPLATPDSFPFPYPQPYSIQLDLMRTVFSAIEDGKIAIVS
jgi:chromosome transmission fidelity protein 1